MPQDIQEKMKKYLAMKNNPGLGVFMTLQEIIKQNENTSEQLKGENKKAIEEALKKMTEMMEKSVEEKIMSSIETRVGEVLEELVQKNINTKMKGDQGEPGKTPQRGKDYWTDRDIAEATSLIQSMIRMPKDGVDGSNGITPIAGIDFPSREQIEKQIRAYVSKIKIPQPIDGKTPRKGIDYFTRNEIQSIVLQVEASLRPDKVVRGIETLTGEKRLSAKALKDWDFLVGVGGGKRKIHRGGQDFSWETPSGTINGVNTTFVLSITPYDSNMMMLFVNGLLQRKNSIGLTDNDYSVSGMTITTNTAPPTGSVIWAFVRK